MTEEQIKEESLKIYNQRIQEEKIQKAANELYDAANKMTIINNSCQSFYDKWLDVSNKLVKLNDVWQTFLSDRDYKKFCEEYTKISI